jgi:hypothetical protein
MVCTAKEVTIGTASKTNGMKYTLPAGVSGVKSPNPVLSVYIYTLLKDIPMVTEVTIHAYTALLTISFVPVKCRFEI